MKKLYVVLALFLTLNAWAVDPRLEQGARFEAQGEYEKALGEYRAILAEFPNSSEAYFAAAEVRYKMKDYGGALANYRLAYKFTPTMSAAYEGAAKVYKTLGDNKKAEAELAKDPKNQPVAETPENNDAIKPEGTPENSQAQAPEAPVEKEEPAKVEEVKKEEVAEVQKQENAPKEAEKEAPKVAEKEEKKDEIIPSKTSEEPVVKNAEEQKTVEKIEEKVDLLEKGKSLLAEGKYNDAVPVWREILAKEPGHLGAYYYAGVTRYYLGEMDKAEFNLKKGLNYKEANNEGYYYLALVYQKLNKAEQERQHLAVYIKKAAPDGKFRTEAEARYAEITKPKEEVASSASSDSVKVTENKESVKVVETPQEVPAVQEKPSLQMALSLFKEKKYEESLQQFKNILEQEISPDERYFSLLQMGNIYREMRDFHSAVVRYREVVQEFPDSDWATEAERALEDAVWLEKRASELPRKKR